MSIAEIMFDLFMAVIMPALIGFVLNIVLGVAGIHFLPIVAPVVAVTYIQKLLSILFGVAIFIAWRLLSTMAAPVLAFIYMQQFLTTAVQPAPIAPIEPPADSPTETPLDLSLPVPSSDTPPDPAIETRSDSSSPVSSSETPLEQPTGTPSDSSSLASSSDTPPASPLVIDLVPPGLRDDFSFQPIFQIGMGPWLAPLAFEYIPDRAEG